MCYFPRCESILSMPFCIPGSPIPLARQTRFLVGRVLFGSASISITWFEINLLFEESRSTFRTIPKEPGCSTGLGSKSFPSAFRTAGFQPAPFLATRRWVGFGVMLRASQVGRDILVGLLRVGRIRNRHDQDCRQRANHSPLVHASRAFRC